MQMIHRKWLVAWICSFIIFLVMGSARMSGMLFLPVMARYNAGRSQAALPFALSYAITFGAGPWIGYLGDRFGLRFVTVAGCLLASLSVSASFFAEDIITFTILWGGIYGLGCGFGTILIPQMLSEYFETKSALANGIASGGVCLSGFCLPAVVDIFLKHYGVSGTCLILSGLMLHSVPLAMLLWSPNRHDYHKKESKKVDKMNTNNTVTHVNKAFTDTELITSSYSETESNLPSESKIYTACAVLQRKNLQDAKKYSEQTACCVNTKSMSPLENNANGMRIFTIQNRGFCAETNFKANLGNCPKSETYTVVEDAADFEKTISSSVAACSPKQGSRCGTKDSSTRARSESSRFRVFLDPIYVIILLTQSANLFTVSFILTIVIDLGRDIGVAEDEGPYLLMSFSVGDAIGRFFLGFVTDRGYLGKVEFYALCFAISGAALLILLWFGGIVVLIVVLFVNGLFFGGTFPVSPGLCSQYIKKELLGMALASRNVLLLPMSFTTSPLIGLFRGQWGSYKPIILLLSIINFTCAFTSLLIPYAARRRDKKKTLQLSTNSHM